MEKDFLEEYFTHRYKSRESVRKDSFISFLYENTSPDFPMIDKETAWKKLDQKLTKRKKISWIGIAASISLLIVVGVIFLFLNNSPDANVISAKSELVKITLPDGSTTIINRNSKIIYPDNFAENRSLALVGEAYFDVKESDIPFIIKTNGVSVQVLGTAFNLSADKDFVQLFVERGLVAFTRDDKVQAKIEPGTFATFDRKSNKILLDNDPSNQNILSWKTGILVFEEATLEKVIPALEKHYGVRFKLGNPKLKQCKVSATFDNISIESVVSVLASILDVKIDVKKGNILKISGAGC